MFLNKYIDELYYNLLLDTYNLDYLNSLDEKNFQEVYKIFIKHRLYFINDIILKYLEVFTYNPKNIDNKLIKLENKLGKNYALKIGANLSYLGEIL